MYDGALQFWDIDVYKVLARIIKNKEFIYRNRAIFHGGQHWHWIWCLVAYCLPTFWTLSRKLSRAMFSSIN